MTEIATQARDSEREDPAAAVLEGVCLPNPWGPPEHSLLAAREVTTWWAGRYHEGRGEPLRPWATRCQQPVCDATTPGSLTRPKPANRPNLAFSARHPTVPHLVCRWL